MRYGIGPNKVMNITLKPGTMKQWAYSADTGSRIVQGVANMFDHSGEREMTSHIKEKPSRITSNAKNRDKIRDKHLSCIAPLDPYSHLAAFVLVVTGLISSEMVNAHEAVDIGNGQLVSFEKSWPDGFTLLSKLVMTMAVNRNIAKFWKNNVHDTYLIYSRVLGLHQSRDIFMKTVLNFERSPVPTSMFDNEGKMRIATTKSKLKTELQVTMSQRLVKKSEVYCKYWMAVLSFVWIKELKKISSTGSGGMLWKGW